MASQPGGFDRNLIVLPFDHRWSFESGLLGHGRRLDEAEADRLRAFKAIIYDGYLEALEDGVPSETSAILVDQTYGEAILADGRARSLTTCAPMERSGQPDFDFEYGDDVRRRLDDAAPTFTKALVRYNPEGDLAMNATQRERLKVLSDSASSAGYRVHVRAPGPSDARPA